MKTAEMLFMKETYLLGEPVVLPMFSSKAAHHRD